MIEALAIAVIFAILASERERQSKVSIDGSRPMTDREKDWLEAGVNDPEVEVEDCEWRMVPSYPVSRLIHLVPPESISGWREWLEIEALHMREDRLWDDGDYYANMKEWVLQDPSAVIPIQVIEDSEGRPIGIWDGWHRSGTAIANNVQWLPAYVGRLRPGVSWQPQ